MAKLPNLGELIRTVVRDEVARQLGEMFESLAPTPAATNAPPRRAPKSEGPKITEGKKRAGARTCKICGVPGHNARGHEKWAAAQEGKKVETA